MKNYLEYADKNGNFHTMNLNGYAVQLSMLDVQERELFVYNSFLERARRVAKYYCDKHNMDEKTAVLYIASGLYAKFLDLRERDIKKHDGVHFNSMEYCNMLRVFKQLRYALDRANCKPTTAYTQTYYAPGVAVSFDNGRELVVPGHTVKGVLQERPQVTNTKMFDIIDVVEMWENRYSRKRARFMEAVNALNSERDDTDVKISLNENELNDDDARAIRSKMARMSRDKNDLRNMVELNGVYPGPLQELLQVCERERARQALASDKRYADVMRIVASKKDMTSTERNIIARFRERNNLFFNRYDDKGKCVSSEPITRDELIYLIG